MKNNVKTKANFSPREIRTLLYSCPRIFYSVNPFIFRRVLFFVLLPQRHIIAFWYEKFTLYDICERFIYILYGFLFERMVVFYAFIIKYIFFYMDNYYS